MARKEEALKEQALKDTSPSGEPGGLALREELDPQRSLLGLHTAEPSPPRGPNRDFRQVSRIHATGLRAVAGKDISPQGEYPAG